MSDGWLETTGTEFGEVDNPDYPGNSKAPWDQTQWNKGAWGDDISGWHTQGVALRHAPRGTLVKLRNPTTGATVIAPVKDRGPGESTGAGIDMLPGTVSALGFETNYKGPVEYQVLGGGAFDETQDTHDTVKISTLPEHLDLSGWDQPHNEPAPQEIAEAPPVAKSLLQEFYDRNPNINATQEGILAQMHELYAPSMPEDQFKAAATTPGGVDIIKEWQERIKTPFEQIRDGHPEWAAYDDDKLLKILYNTWSENGQLDAGKLSLDQFKWRMKPPTDAVNQTERFLNETLAEVEPKSASTALWAVSGTEQHALDNAEPTIRGILAKVYSPDTNVDDLVKAYQKMTPQERAKEFARARAQFKQSDDGLRLLDQLNTTFETFDKASQIQESIDWMKKSLVTLDQSGPNQLPPDQEKWAQTIAQLPSQAIVAIAPGFREMALFGSLYAENKAAIEQNNPGMGNAEVARKAEAATWWSFPGNELLQLSFMRGGPAIAGTIANRIKGIGLELGKEAAFGAGVGGANQVFTNIAAGRDPMHGVFESAGTMATLGLGGRTLGLTVEGLARAMKHVPEIRQAMNISSDIVGASPEEANKIVRGDPSAQVNQKATRNSIDLILSATQQRAEERRIMSGRLTEKEAAAEDIAGQRQREKDILAGRQPRQRGYQPAPDIVPEERLTPEPEKAPAEEAREKAVNARNNGDLDAASKHINEMTTLLADPDKKEHHKAVADGLKGVTRNNSSAKVANVTGFFGLDDVPGKRVKRGEQGAAFNIFGGRRGISPKTETITAAAVKQGEVVGQGTTHAHAIDDLNAKGGKLSDEQVERYYQTGAQEGAEYGFVTNTGRFISREEAQQISGARGGEAAQIVPQGDPIVEKLKLLGLPDNQVTRAMANRALRADESGKETLLVSAVKDTRTGRIVTNERGHLLAMRELLGRKPTETKPSWTEVPGGLEREEEGPTPDYVEYGYLTNKGRFTDSPMDLARQTEAEGEGAEEVDEVHRRKMETLHTEWIRAETPEEKRKIWSQISNLNWEKTQRERASHKPRTAEEKRAYEEHWIKRDEEKFQDWLARGGLKQIPSDASPNAKKDPYYQYSPEDVQTSLPREAGEEGPPLLEGTEEAEAFSGGNPLPFIRKGAQMFRNTDLFRKSFDAVSRTLAPQRRGPGAKDTAALAIGVTSRVKTGILLGLKAIAEDLDLNSLFRDAYRSDRRDAKWRQYADQQIAAWQTIRQKGGKVGIEFVDKMFDYVEACYGWLEDIGRANGIEFGHLANYFHHAFKNPEGEVENTLKDWEPKFGKQAFQKTRHYPTLADAIEAGLTPKSYSPERNLMAYAAAMTTAVRQVQTLKSMAIENLALPITDVREQGLTKQKGYQLYTAPDGKSYYVRNDAAGVLANAFDLHSIYDTMAGPFVGFARAFKGVTGIKLSWSVFHPVHIAGIAAAETLTTAMQRGIQGTGTAKDFLDAVKAAATFGVEPMISATAKYGRLVDALTTGKGLDALTDQQKTDYNDLLEMGIVPYMSDERRSTFADMIFRGGKEAETVRNIAELGYKFLTLEPYQEFMFGKVIPATKIAAALARRDTLLRKHGEAFRSDANAMARKREFLEINRDIEGRFGEMCYDNLFWSRWAKQAGLAIPLSLGWNLGFWRVYGDGIIDLMDNTAHMAKLNLDNKKAPGLSNRLLYMANYTAMSLLANAVITYGMTQTMPQLADFFFPRIGKKPNGDDERVRTPFWTGEIASLGEHFQENLYKNQTYPEAVGGALMNYFGNKANPGLASIWHLLNNKNFMGRDIYDQRDPWQKKLMDQVSFALSDMIEPISWQGGTDARGIPNEPRQVIASFLGFTQAPGWTTRTPLQNEIITMFHDQLGTHPTKRQSDIFDAKTRYQYAIQAGNRQMQAESLATLHELGAGPRVIEDARKYARIPPAHRAYQGLTEDRQADLLRHMSPSEYHEYWPLTKAQAKMEYLKTQ